ncbi:MAG: ABC transporter substrate-binding protein [Verrucomicrobiota bacterium]
MRVDVLSLRPSASSLALLGLVLAVFSLSGVNALTITKAENLSIKESDSGFLVSIRDPVFPENFSSYHLVPRSEIPTVIERSSQNETTIPFPAERIVSLSTTYLGPLNELDSLDRVVAVDDASYAFTENLRKAVGAGEIVEVGGTGVTGLESIIAANPDLVLLTRINPEDNHLEKQLKSAGIPVIITSAWTEPNPLGRAEWIKLFGILTDRISQADQIYAEVSEEYDALQKRVRSENRERPKVLLSAPFGGVWHIPGNKGFTAKLLDDAGADYLGTKVDRTGSIPIGLESALQLGFSADFWLDPGQFESLASLSQADPRFRLLPPLESGEVYNRTKRVAENGGNDFWESGIIYPNKVLADLIHIFHPEILPDHEFFYYEKLE